jgi:hypothetical protein
VNEQLSGPFHLLEDEAFPAKEARAYAPREGNTQVQVAHGTKERILLTENLL